MRRVGEPLGTKVEIKNLNSFKSVQRALEYEIRRQTEILRRGEKVKQATMGFEEGSGKTYPMRTKEEEADYRYFPEPDLPPVAIPRDWLEEVRRSLPALPWEKEARYRALGIKGKDAEVLAYTPSLARFLDQALPLGLASPQALANWLLADVAGLLHERGLRLEETRLTPRASPGSWGSLSGERSRAGWPKASSPRSSRARTRRPWCGNGGSRWWRTRGR